MLRCAVMSAPHPTEVRRLPEAGKLRVTWTDGHVAEYDYDYLRGYCPCAGCQGHSVSEIEFKQPEMSVRATTIEPVGNYAISILWSDGHATGIYRFDFLRRICPCESCQGLAATAPAPEAGEQEANRQGEEK